MKTYGDHDRIEEILRQWAGPPGTPTGIAKKAKISRDRALTVLQSLEREGLAGRYKNKFWYAARGVAGVLTVTAGNAAFVSTGDGAPDIMIPRRLHEGALSGDAVLVLIDAIEGDPRSGSVIRVLKRRTRGVAGVVCRAGRGGRIIPRLARLPELYIAKEDMKEGAGQDIREGDLVFAEILQYPKGKGPAPGGAVRRLGASGDPAAELLCIAYNHGFREAFPEMGSVPDRISDSELRGRIDYREDFIMTIDGADAQDFDDAVGVSATGDGGFRLLVHIADVSHYIPVGSPADQEAYDRGTSLYLPGLTLPMLPEALSNGICSLRPGVDRLCVTIALDFDACGNRRIYDIHPSVIRSRHRMTYHTVNRLLDGDESLAAVLPDVLSQIKLMKALSDLLRAQRFRDGGIDLDLGESVVEIGGDLAVRDIRAAERGASERIVEDFMIAANQAIAHYLRVHELPGVYRAHAAPRQERLRVFASFAKGFDVHLRKNRQKITPQALQEALDNAPEALRSILARDLLRALERAEYLPDPLGHYGLGSADYCHFTSPIRRYPDLLVHHTLRAYRMGDGAALERIARRLAESCRQSSERERMAMEAEREADAYRKAEFMARYIGQRYTAIVVGMARWAIFLSLPNSCEGALPLVAIDSDAYEYDADQRILIGARKQNIVRMGDVLEVVVASASPEERTVYLALAP